LALSVVLFMYQPTLDSLFSTLPWNLGDPALNTWILSWEWHAIIHDPGRFFQGNIFHPFGDAIKYTELMLPLLPVFGPISALGENPILAINLTMLGLSLFCFVATYLLARRLTGDVAAFLAAVGFTFSGYVFMHQSHLQLLTLGFFPLGFLVLFRMLESRRLRDGAWLGICSALLATGSFYYGAIWFVCMGTILLVDLIRLRRPGRDWWGSVGVAAAVCVILLGPIAFVYAEFQSQSSFVRDTAGYGLRPLDFITPAPGSLVYSDLFDWAAARRDTGAVEHGFFLGFVTPILAAAGGVLFSIQSWVHGRRGRTRGARIRELWWVVLAGIVSISVAVGPRLYGIPLPLHFLREYVPGFDAMRAVSRLAVPGLLTACLLAAWCLDRLTRARSPEARIIIAAVVISAVMVEMYVEPLTVEVPEAPAVIVALAEAAEGAVVELPMREEFDAQFPSIEGPRLLASVGDWRPRFNGYSGGVPDGYMDYVIRLNRFPEADGLAAVNELGIRYVVIHAAEGESHSALSLVDIEAMLAFRPKDIAVERFGDALLVDMMAAGR